MRWPWSARAEEARQAAEAARRGLEESRARRQHVEKEARNLRLIREANHFSQMFEQIISGRG